MEAERLSPGAQLINQKLEYSALIGLFTQACRTPAKFEFSPNGKEVIAHFLGFWSRKKI